MGHRHHRHHKRSNNHKNHKYSVLSKVKNKMATNTIKFSKDQINVPTKNVKTENVSKIVLTPQNIKLKLKIEPSKENKKKENKKIELSKERYNKNKLDTIRFRKDEINVPT